MNTQTAYQIKEANWPQKTFVVKKAKLAIDKLPAFFGDAYGAMYAFIHKMSLQANEPPCAIYYTFDETKKETEMAAAVPVQGTVPENTEFETLTLPPSAVITTTHMGPYSSMAPAYQAMQAYLKDHGLKEELIIEEYFSDPETEKDPGKLRTDIHFILSKANN